MEIHQFIIQTIADFIVLIHIYNYKVEEILN